MPVATTADVVHAATAASAHDDTSALLPIVHARGHLIDHVTIDPCNVALFSQHVWRRDHDGEVYTDVHGRRRYLAHVVAGLDHLHTVYVLPRPRREYNYHHRM